jgi:hypothetical protein
VTSLEQPTLVAAAKRIAFLEDENARYKAALRRIANANSGVWGRIAGEALRGER